MKYQESTLQKSNRDCSAVKDAEALLKEHGFPEEEIRRFTERAVYVLDRLAVRFGEGTPFQYMVSKHMGRINLRIVVRGERFNPMEDEEDTILFAALGLPMEYVGLYVIYKVFYHQHRLRRM